MAAGPPTLRRRLLGRELRRLREERKLTLAKAAAMVDRTDGALSRVENGHNVIRPIDVRNLLDAYEVADDRIRETLVTLARDARKRGWWHSYADVVPPAYADFIDIESEAARVRSFQMTVIDGLLQIEDYARADIGGPLMDSTPSIVDNRVRVRMDRQDVLRHREPPLVLDIVFAEAALRLQVGGPQVLRKQLEFLVEAGARPNISLRILPESIGAHPGTYGSFTIVEFAEPAKVEVVMVELLTGCMYLEQPGEISEYAQAFDYLARASLGPQQSQAMLTCMMEAL